MLDLNKYDFNEEEIFAAGIHSSYIFMATEKYANKCTQFIPKCALLTFNILFFLKQELCDFRWFYSINFSNLTTLSHKSLICAGTFRTMTAVIRDSKPSKFLTVLLAKYCLAFWWDQVFLFFFNNIYVRSFSFNLMNSSPHLWMQASM